MPKEIQAVQCERCGKLLNKEKGLYILISKVEIQGHVYEKGECPEVAVEDKVVCNNSCLAGLLALVGF